MSYHECPAVGGCPNCYAEVKRICPRCLAEKTDKQWFGSACFKGTCKPKPILDDTYWFELANRRPKNPDWRYISAYQSSKMRGA